jgi:hypothetical protein
MRHFLNNICLRFHPRKNNGTRYHFYILFFLTTAIGLPVLSQVSKYPLVHTPENVMVNTTLPKNILSAEEPVTANFSKEPTDAEIFAVHFFEEPLVPANGNYSATENEALVLALANFSQRTSPDDFTPIIGFLNAYPKSRWRGALLADMGILYRRTGYYNKAIGAWEQSWALLKNEKNVKVKLLADKVVSELLMINSC